MEDICRGICRGKRDSIKIKNEDVAVRNLTVIFNATLELGNRKGFQAMSLRDLSESTGLSLGALYAYFSGKEELLDLILTQGWLITNRILTEQIPSDGEPLERLRTGIRTHLYLSEMLHPWFFFSYMEAKNLPREEIRKIIKAELFTEKIFSDILEEGTKLNMFRLGKSNIQMTASMIKALLQDWYLKRWKYTQRGVSIDDYALFVTRAIEVIVMPVEPSLSE
ncbi:MAG: helix-turn-helix transcriptional regulator [Spirochaetes bacterium]|nr:helix-turn-helix transcriptional regulator [Spirochaetota bacterium]